MLRAEIERLFDENPEHYSESDHELFQRFKNALNAGEIRAAEPDEASKTGWRVNAWVKKGILLGFRIGHLVEMCSQGAQQDFFDKSTYPLKTFSIDSGVRIVRQNGKCLLSRADTIDAAAGLSRCKTPGQHSVLTVRKRLVRRRNRRSSAQVRNERRNPITQPDLPELCADEQLSHRLLVWFPREIFRENPNSTMVSARVGLTKARDRRTPSAC